MARQWISCSDWRRVRHRIILLLGTVWLAAFGSSGSARANVVVDVNNALLNIIQNTSAALVDGPTEVAREIALIDGAMFDAVNAASGSPYPPIAYQGGPVSGADPNAAAAVCGSATCVLVPPVLADPNAAGAGSARSAV